MSKPSRDSSSFSELVSRTQQNTALLFNPGSSVSSSEMISPLAERLEDFSILAAPVAGLGHPVIDTFDMRMQYLLT